MLSKCKGQFLRVTGCLHALFAIDHSTSGSEPLQAIPSVVSEASVKAALNFVNTCMNHTMYLCGRQNINSEIMDLAVDLDDADGETCVPNATRNPEGYVLLLPGKKLHITALNEKKKFRDMGNKQGAVAAITTLEQEDLGIVVLNKAQGTAKVCMGMKTGKHRICSRFSGYV